MSSADIVMQDEEFEALSSILDEDSFVVTRKSSDKTTTEGTLIVEVTLPDHFHVEYYPNQSRQVQYLPPIFLRFEIPDDYPSVSPPRFQLDCIWMNDKQLKILTENLNKIWLENEHQSILFLWYSSLGADCLDWLNISQVLDLTLTFPTSINEFSNLTLTSAQVAMTIHNHNRERKLFLLYKSIVTCPICVDEYYGTDCFCCYKCSSVACKSCVKSYLETMINEGKVSVLTCPIDPSCNVDLTPTQVASIVDKTAFRRYDRLLFQSSIDAMDDIIYCPRCQKPVIISKNDENDLNNRLGECATCMFVFCTICGKTFHGINPCQYSSEKMKEIYREYRNSSPEDRLKLEQQYGKIFGRLMDDMASVEMIKSTARQCPQCSIFVDKLDGCNKMTCVKCHGYFCWLCLQSLSKTDPYGHFNKPGGKCFGKLFEGVAEMDFW